MPTTTIPEPIDFDNISLTDYQGIFINPGLRRGYAIEKTTNQKWEIKEDGSRRKIDKFEYNDCVAHAIPIEEFDWESWLTSHQAISTGEAEEPSIEETAGPKIVLDTFANIVGADAHVPPPLPTESSDPPTEETTGETTEEDCLPPAEPEISADLKYHAAEMNRRYYGIEDNEYAETGRSIFLRRQEGTAKFSFDGSDDEYDIWLRCWDEDDGELATITLEDGKGTELHTVTLDSPDTSSGAAGADNDRLVNCGRYNVANGDKFTIRSSRMGTTEMGRVDWVGFTPATTEGEHNA